MTVASPARFQPPVPQPNRHTLDLQWLQRLRAEGTDRLLPDPPAPPSLVFQGIDEFNRGAFWHCHETLEEVWRETPYPLKLFYYGLIKVAVGFEHVGRHHQRSAMSQLTAAVANLEPFLPVFLGVRVAPLVAEVNTWLDPLRVPDVPWAELDALARPKMMLALA